MTSDKRLRIDLNCDEKAIDYRIRAGAVEMRVLEGPRQGAARFKKAWRRLSTEQVSAELESNSVVAVWLKRRMGIHRLLRVCTDFRPKMAA